MLQFIVSSVVAAIVLVFIALYLWGKIGNVKAIKAAQKKQDQKDYHLSQLKQKGMFKKK